MHRADRQHQRNTGAGEEGCADEVEPSPLGGVLVGRQREPAGSEDRDPHGHIEKEDPVPRYEIRNGDTKRGTHDDAQHCCPRDIRKSPPLP